ncbi:hypothetical protein H0H93_008022 [Arthromyces matolae]|nr:hypothetical protein H0H93_008022 [Arthromyces matolae]
MMKPSTKALILLACLVSPIPFFPVTDATPIPVPNTLYLRNPRPQTISSLTAVDIDIVHSDHASLYTTRDSPIQDGSHNLDTGTILFPRADTGKHPPLPQLSLLVLDTDTECKMQSDYRKELQKRLNEYQDDPEISTLSPQDYDMHVIHMMMEANNLVEWELSLVEKGVLGYDEYRPKLIHIMKELITFFQRASNGSVNQFARNFVTMCVDVEAKHGKRYLGVIYDRGRYSVSISRNYGVGNYYSGEELLKQLEKEWKEMADKQGGKGGRLPTEGKGSECPVLQLRPAPGSHTEGTKQTQR